jgi:glutamate formiminotransferase
MKKMINQQLIECVPNVSEGRNPAIINKLAQHIDGHSGIRLLNVSSGYDDNRTVYTFAGAPENIATVVLEMYGLALQLIDMRQHAGVHLRLGALDVCPFVPIRNITKHEAVNLANQCAQQVANTYGIPVYLYEYSARHQYRRRLETIRRGGYEQLQQKLLHPDWKPDFGPDAMHKLFGATVIGARDLMVAFNVNLATRNIEKAKAIAGIVRESKSKFDGMINEHDIPHKWCKMKGVKAMAWHLDTVGITQVSMNITDLESQTMLTVFRAVKFIAGLLDIGVNGSEVVGLVPERVLRAPGYSLDQLVRELGLNAFKAFDPDSRIIERVIQ